MSKLNRTECELISWLNGEKLGKGHGSCSAYETAWAARIRSSIDHDQPAFPKSLEWIRNKQHNDGSWGALYPFNIFDRCLSTLMTVIVLREWGYAQDQQRIEHGIAFLKRNISSLESINELKNRMTCGFDYIFPELLKQASHLGINFNCQSVLAIYDNERTIKLKKVKLAMKLMKEGPWIYNIEGLSELYDKQSLKNFIHNETKLICGCYSATLSALKQGVLSETSLEYIRKVINENRGGVPAFYPLKVFDLAWSIAYLKWSGFDINHPVLIPHLKLLEKEWYKCGGDISSIGSDAITPDADDISMVIYVLNSAKILSGVDSLKPLMKYYRNGHFITWEGERRPSFSVNVHALNAMRNHQDHLIEERNTVYKWLKQQLIESNFTLIDRWNHSTYYSLTRTMIAIDYIDEEMSEQIFHHLIKAQNQDGGWGQESSGSSALETAMVIIAITYHMRTNPGLMSSKLFNNILARSSAFLMTNADKIGEFWNGKTSYSIKALDHTIILSAKYAILNFQKC